MAGENIKLRYAKGDRLSFTEMDDNFSQFVYSGSISGTGSSRALKLHYTGSSALGISYVPRTSSISIPGHWIISDGANNEVINPGDTVNFVGNGATSVSYTAGINTVTITGVDEDVTVSNLRTRLGQISDDTTIGDATDVTMTFSGDVDVVGTLTAKEFHTTLVSASIVYQSGSTLFGNSSDDKHEFTGSIIGSQTSNIIPFYYANQGVFPSATSFHGAIAHSHADARMYYAHGGTWNKLLSNTDTGSLLLTASFDTNTRNLTLERGDGTSFNLNIPDADTQNTYTAGNGLNENSNEFSLNTGSAHFISGSWSTLTAGTNVSITNGTISSTDTNTFRTVQADGVSIGATETLNLVAGTNVTLSENNGEITISSTDTNTDTNTTYSISAETTTGGSNLRLTDSTTGTDDVAFKGSGATTVTRTDANTITISSTDTNTTYSTFTDNADGLVPNPGEDGDTKFLRQDGTWVVPTDTDTNTFRTVTAGGNTLGATETLAFTEGTGISITEDAGAVTITCNVVDTNTTYSAGNGLGLSVGNEFSLDTPGTLTVATSNGVTANSHTHAITTTTNGTASTIVATDSSSEITAANFVTTSDRRLKSEIEPIKDGLAVIKEIASYEYYKNGVKEAGFIAQEVQEALPYAVREGEDGYLKMTDRAILAHLHKAVQQLEERLSAVEEKLG